MVSSARAVRSGLARWIPFTRSKIGNGRKTPASVIVIGAGIGGLAAAARLARAGLRVTVVEKAPMPGGRVSQFKRDGYTFDTGATMILAPKVFAQTYSELGERFEEHLDLVRVDPSCRIHYDDGTHFDLTGDLKALQAQMERIEPGSFARALRYIAEGAEMMDVGLREFLGRDFETFFEFFSPANLPLLLRMKVLVNHYTNVSRYFEDDRLRKAFSFQNMYLGLSPFDAPATYSVLQFTELADGVHFPRGGMYQLIESLYGLARKWGVVFRFNAPVARIDVAGSRATGVTLAGGEHLPADLVLANADLPYVFARLLPDDGEADRLRKLKYTSSQLVFLWGVNRRYPQLGQHNLFIARDYRASFDRIFHDLALPDDPSFYINVPARGDPTLAPPDKDGIMAMVPVGHLDQDHPQDWDALRDRAREAVLRRLEQVGISDLRESNAFEATFGPPDYESQLNLMKGAAFGLAYNFTQIGYLRPHNQHRRYRNLYFVGASTHPGGGLPIVLMSAKLTTERMLRDAALRSRSVRAVARVA